MKNKADPVELRLIAVVERRADAVEGVEVGAQDGEGHDGPDEGDQSDDAEEPVAGRKVPRHTAHEDYKVDRYLEYPREPIPPVELLAPAAEHHIAPTLAGDGSRAAQPAPEPGPAPGPALLRAPAADPTPSGDQELHGVPALEPSLATIPREELNLLECTSVEVGASSGEVKLSYEMGDLRHDHPLLRRLANPYTYYLRGLLPARPSKFIVGNIPVLDSAGLCDWFNGEFEFECARAFLSLFFCVCFVLSVWFGLCCAHAEQC